VPGLLFFSLRILAEALLVAVRGILRALGVGASDADRYEPVVRHPAPTSDRMRPPRRRAAPRRAEPAREPEPAPVGGASVGAQVHVAEPWRGYDAMRLDDVLARLQAASEVELAIVRAYEREHEARQAVLLACGEPA
jgi:hypothetical protein